MHFSVCSCFCAEEALYTDMLSTYPIKRHFFVFVLTVTCIASYLSFKKESTDQKWKSFYQFLPNVRLNSSGDLSLNEKLAPQNLWPPNKVNDYKKVDLFILGLFELSTKFGAKPESRTEVEAAKLAINHVNTRNILPYYRLNLLINDTKVRFQAFTLLNYDFSICTFPYINEYIYTYQWFLFKKRIRY